MIDNLEKFLKGKIKGYSDARKNTGSILEYA